MTQRSQSDEHNPDYSHLANSLLPPNGSFYTGWNQTANQHWQPNLQGLQLELINENSPSFPGQLQYSAFADNTMYDLSRCDRLDDGAQSREFSATASFNHFDEEKPHNKTAATKDHTDVGGVGISVPSSALQTQTPKVPLQAVSRSLGASAGSLAELKMKAKESILAKRAQSIRSPPNGTTLHTCVTVNAISSTQETKERKKFRKATSVEIDDLLAEGRAAAEFTTSVGATNSLPMRMDHEDFSIDGLQQGHGDHRPRPASKDATRNKSETTQPFRQPLSSAAPGEPPEPGEIFENIGDVVTEPELSTLSHGASITVERLQNSSGLESRLTTRTLTVDSHGTALPTSNGGLILSLSRVDDEKDSNAEKTATKKCSPRLSRTSDMAQHLQTPESTHTMSCETMLELTESGRTLSNNTGFEMTNAEASDEGLQHTDHQSMRQPLNKTSKELEMDIATSTEQKEWSIDDVEDWLAMTGFYDAPYRRKLLGRRRRMKAIDEERMRLLLEEQEDQEQRNQLIRSQSVMGVTKPPTSDARHYARATSITAMPSPFIAPQSNLIMGFKIRDLAVKNGNTPNTTEVEIKDLRKATLKRQNSLSTPKMADSQPLQKMIRIDADKASKDSTTTEKADLQQTQTVEQDLPSSVIQPHPKSLTKSREHFVPTPPEQRPYLFARQVQTPRRSSPHRSTNRGYDQWLPNRSPGEEGRRRGYSELRDQQFGPGYRRGGSPGYEYRPDHVWSTYSNHRDGYDREHDHPGRGSRTDLPRARRDTVETRAGGKTRRHHAQYDSLACARR